MNGLLRLQEQQGLLKPKQRRLELEALPAPKANSRRSQNNIDQNLLVAAAIVLEDQHSTTGSGESSSAAAPNTSVPVRQPSLPGSNPRHSNTTTKKDKNFAAANVMHDFFESTNCTEKPIQPSDVSPAPRKRNYLRETDLGKGRDLAQAALSQLDQSVWGASPDRRQVALAKLISDLSTELSSSSQVEAASTETLIANRLQASIQTLKQPQVYNTNAGQALIHQVWQSVADPDLGAEDPALSAIASRLNASKVETVKTCFAERKHHGFGYVPPKKQRSDALEEWLVAVPVPFSSLAF